MRALLGTGQHRGHIHVDYAQHRCQERVGGTLLWGVVAVADNRGGISMADRYGDPIHWGPTLRKKSISCNVLYS